MGSNVLSALRSLSRNDILPWMPALGSASLAITVDQLAYRLFSTRSSSRWAHCAAALTGVATLAAASFNFQASPAIRLAAPGLYVVYKMVQLVWNSKTPSKPRPKPAVPERKKAPIIPASPPQPPSAVGKIHFYVNMLIDEIEKKQQDSAVGLYRSNELRPKETQKLESEKKLKNIVSFLQTKGASEQAYGVKFLLKRLDPYLLEPQYDAFRAAWPVTDEQKKQDLQKAITSLPDGRLQLLQTLILHLARVCEAQKNNPEAERMTSQGLASMMAPHFFNPEVRPVEEYTAAIRPLNSIIQYLIDNAESFFPSAKSPAAIG